MILRRSSRKLMKIDVLLDACPPHGTTFDALSSTIFAILDLSVLVPD